MLRGCENNARRSRSSSAERSKNEQVIKIDKFSFIYLDMRQQAVTLRESSVGFTNLPARQMEPSAEAADDHLNKECTTSFAGT